MSAAAETVAVVRELGAWDKPPANQLQLEAQFIGFALGRPEVVRPYVLAIPAAVFLSNTHARIWEAMQTLCRADAIIDDAGVSSVLNTIGRLPEMVSPDSTKFGAEAVWALIPYGYSIAANSPSELFSHVESLLEAYRVRRSGELAAMLFRESHQGIKTGTAARKKIVRELLALDEFQLLKAGSTAGERMAAAFERAQQKRDQDGFSACSGFRNFDRLTGGLRPGRTIAIGARSGVGKTAFALQIALEVAIGGMGVLFLNCELPRDEIDLRLLSLAARVDNRHLQERTLTPDEADRCTNALVSLQNVPLLIEDMPNATMDEVRAVVASRMAMAEKPIGLVVCDYLQKLKAPPGKRYGTNAERIADISDGFTRMAREYGIAAIELVQLNRAIDGRKGTDATPRMSDLAESSGIERDAHAVVVLWNADASRPDRVTASCIKARLGGERGEVEFDFFGQFGRFAEAR